MDRLPLEIRHIIAKCTNDESKESLRALSQVNREWNGIAGSILYHHLIIRLGSQATSQKLFHLSHTRRVFEQVRRLSIALISTFQESNNPRMHIGNVPEIEGLGDEPVPHINSYPRGDWTAIIDLIQQLPHLHDVKILAKYRGPVELYEALSQYHPTCRVTMFNACIHRSNPNHVEFCTARLLSPVLHGVHVTCSEDREMRIFQEHPDGILQKILLFAPHIRQIALQINEDRYPCSQENRYKETKLKSQLPSGETPVHAKLKSLCWPLNSKMTAAQFQKWQKITDHSLLKSWTVGCIEDSTLMQTIVYIHPFRQQTRLTLALFQPKTGDPGFWLAAESMFKSLPPLKYLCLLGIYEPNFLSSAVLCRHGPTLTELKLHKGCYLWKDEELRRLSNKGQIGPRFSSQNILELAAQCPSLRKLRICLQRRQGLETDAYTALGQFPCLEELDLVLNCLPEMDTNLKPVPARELTDFESSPAEYDYNYCPKWFLRDSMINCAIDETLAKAIFTHILASQGAKRLMKLTIHPLFGQAAQYPYYNPQGREIAMNGDNRLLTQLALTWTVEREFLTELHVRATKCLSYGIGYLNPLQDGTLSIFKSIWPTKADIITWPLDWHSFPLQSV